MFIAAAFGCVVRTTVMSFFFIRDVFLVLTGLFVRVSEVPGSVNFMCLGLLRMMSGLGFSGALGACFWVVSACSSWDFLTTTSSFLSFVTVLSCCDAMLRVMLFWESGRLQLGVTDGDGGGDDGGGLGGGPVFVEAGM